MRELKVLFVGVGSIAKRHIRNLRTIAAEKGFSLKTDAFRRSYSTEPEEGIDKEYTCFSSVPNDYDAIFITNPTELHLETLKKFHDKGKHFFIEKPVVSISQIDEAKKIELREDSIYYVACPLRYNAVIQYIKNNINADDVISIRSISSSYLPDWRPGQDYRDTYSAHREMGGGVSIDLIHEWDYLSYLFGKPQKVFGMHGKKSNLEIDSDDYAIYIAEYSDKIVELHLDYFGRKTIREVQIFTNNDTITGDIANNQIHFWKDQRTIDFCENRDDFQIRELEHFIDLIWGIKKAENGYWKAIELLGLTQAIV